LLPAEVQEEALVEAKAASMPFQLGGVETASGLKAKARELLASIRLLKWLEADDDREASDEEKRQLARFTGFGAVANHIFPEPGTERYKDS